MSNHTKEKLQKRHTLQTTAGIEDSLAIMIDILNEVEQHQLYVEARLRQLYKILRDLRAGPYAYDPETSAGRRDDNDGKHSQETQELRCQTCKPYIGLRR